MKGLRIPCGCFFPCMGNTDCIIKTGWSLENVFDVFLNFVLLIDSSNSSYPVFLSLAWSILKWPLFLEMYEVSQWSASYPLKLKKNQHFGTQNTCSFIINLFQFQWYHWYHSLFSDWMISSPRSINLEPRSIESSENNSSLQSCYHSKSD